LGYLSRYLADSDTRARLESWVLQTQYVRQWNAHENAKNASIFEGQVRGGISSGRVGFVEEKVDVSRLR